MLNMKQIVDEMAKKLQSNDGNGEYLPPVIKEIDVVELASTQFLTYNPDHEGYTTLAVHSREKHCESGYFWLYGDGTGVFMSRTWSEPEPGKPAWGPGRHMVVRIWKFAHCDHKYGEIGSDRCRELGVTHFGNCYHVLECSECGNVTAYDSSD